MKPEIFALGLTGSIGAGKSTALAIFAESGAATWSADSAVARLYAPGGGGARALAGEFPSAAPDPDGAVDKDALKACIASESRLRRLEELIHPLVRQDRGEAVAEAARNGKGLIALEIPLLYETGGEGEVDAVAVVTAPEEVRRKRVLARPGMTERRFRQLTERQMPDAEKRRRADFAIASTDPERAGRDIAAILREIGEKRGMRQ